MRTAKPKKKNRKQLEKDAWCWFSLFIRLRDADENGIVKCFTCGKPHHWKEMDAGHYKSQGGHPKLKFFEKNVHAQDCYCNRFLHGNLGEYHRLLVEKYGAGIDDEFAIVKANKGRMESQDYEYMILDYKARVEKLLEGMNGQSC